MPFTTLTPAAVGAKRAAFALAFIALLQGCAGGPSLRTQASAQQGALVEGCRNLSDQARVNVLNLNSYRTTMASALLEGGAAGYDEGLGKEGRTDDSAEQLREGGFTKSRSFCRVYSASLPEVTKAIADTLPYLQNDIEFADPESGVFLTDLIEREGFSAKWKDRYAIEAIEEPPNRVVVKVTRLVYISRQNSPFIRGISDGHNETWILTQILDIVGDG